MDFEVRSSTSADAEFIYALTELTLRQYVEAAGKRWANERMREKCVHDAIDPNTRVLCAGEKDIGIYCAAMRDGAFCIDMLSLLPPFQRQGIGTHVLAGARATAAAVGVPLRIQVITTNPAKLFWQVRGFSVIATEGLFHTMQSAA